MLQFKKCLLKRIEVMEKESVSINKLRPVGEAEMEKLDDIHVGERGGEPEDVE